MLAAVLSYLRLVGCAALYIFAARPARRAWPAAVSTITLTNVWPGGVICRTYFKVELLKFHAFGGDLDAA